MRAVVFGLVGLLAGPALAETCALDRATLTAVNTGFEYGGITKVERPDLGGKTFRVARYAERKMMRYSKPRGAMMNAGYEAYEVEGGGSKLLVKREHVNGVPAVTPMSWDASAVPADVKVRWKRSTLPLVTVGSDLDYVLSGPLSALTLRVSACT